MSISTDGKQAVEEVTVLDSAARTADSDTLIYNQTGANLLLEIDVTADPASASVVFTLQGVSASGVKSTILQSAAINGTGTTVLRVSPHLTASANTIAKDVCPRRLNLNANHADTDSITYSVRATFVA